MPDPADVHLLAGDRVVGSIVPSPEFEEDGELHVYPQDGMHDGARDAATAIALSMNANLEWFDDESPPEPR